MTAPIALAVLAFMLAIWPKQMLIFLGCAIPASLVLVFLFGR